MFFPALLLPLATVLINDARAEITDREIAVDISTAEPIAASGVRGVTGARHMYVYLDGTTAIRSTFSKGQDAILVYPRSRYTKLEIPTPKRCLEPVTIERTATGIRVRATCRDANGSVASATPPMHDHQQGVSESPEPSAPRTAAPRPSSMDSLLKAALALPTEISASSGETGLSPGDEARRAPRGKRAAEPIADHAGTAPEEKGAGTAKMPEDGKTERPTAAESGNVPAPKVGTDSTTATVAAEPGSAVASSWAGGERKSASGVGSMVFAVLILVGLGVAAAVFAKRNAKRSRLIRILETASIGPRRSLVVACIGGRTMVLGVSEAGVSLLDSQGSVSPLVDSVSALAQDVDVPRVAGSGVAGLHKELFGAKGSEEAKNETSLLGRLFHRLATSPRRPAREREFNVLLSESLEDQDLRRKLAVGEIGRVA